MELTFLMKSEQEDYIWHPGCVFQLLTAQMASVELEGRRGGEQAAD